MSYVARDDRPADKAARYAELEEEILAVLEGEPNLTARMATVSSMLADGFPATVMGQRAYMMALVREIMAGGGTGIMYWEAGWITSGMRDLWGTGSSWENAALFDFEGNAHAGFDFLTRAY